MNRTHNIKNIRFVEDVLTLDSDGKKPEFNLIEVSKKLLNASETDRNLYRVSPSGYGIHWPLIDEDLAVGGLVRNLLL